MRVSLVLPVYNEEGNLQPLFEEIEQVMGRKYEEYEVIFVDDGSTDSSPGVLEKLGKKHSFVKVIEFRTNFGQTAAIQAGLDYAESDVIVTLDSDMQNNPKDIPKLVNILKDSDYDLVNGWRKERSDPFLKKIFSRIAAWMRRTLLGTSLHDYGCTLKAFRKEAAQDLRMNGEMHRYIPPLLKSKGYNVTEVEVDHRERHSGKTKYGPQKVIRGFIDLIGVWFWKKYEKRPLHLFGALGILSMGAGGFMGIVALYQFWSGIQLSDTAATMVSMFFVLLGIQLSVSGLLADIAIKNGSKISGNNGYNIRKVIE